MLDTLYSPVEYSTLVEGSDIVFEPMIKQYVMFTFTLAELKKVYHRAIEVIEEFRKT